MSLPHALLTALVEHPCSGSELAERFDKSIGYFWHATHQQIYRELARLEQVGLVNVTRIGHIDAVNSHDDVGMRHPPDRDPCLRPDRSQGSQRNTGQLFKRRGGSDALSA